MKKNERNENLIKVYCGNAGDLHCLQYKNNIIFNIFTDIEYNIETNGEAFLEKFENADEYASDRFQGATIQQVEAEIVNDDNFVLIAEFDNNLIFYPKIMGANGREFYAEVRKLLEIPIQDEDEEFEEEKFEYEVKSYEN